MTEENLFAEYRNMSGEQKRYLGKRKKIITAYEFLKTYKELENGEITDELKIKAQEYFWAQNSITCLDDIIPSGVPNSRVINAYNNIKENASTNFIKFYESYMRKIDKNFSEECTNNAVEDMHIAYETYCLANNMEIVPRTNEELKLVYLAIKTKELNNENEIEK